MLGLLCDSFILVYALRLKQTRILFRLRAASFCFYPHYFLPRSTKKMSSSFIVIFKDGTTRGVIDEHIKKAEASGAEIKARFAARIKGYSFETADDNAFSSTIAGHPDVAYVEPDAITTQQ